MIVLFPFLSISVRLVIFIYLTFSFLSVSGQVTSVPEYESFSVTIHFDKIGYKDFPALYDAPSGLFLPVDELFDFLSIYRETSPDGQVIEGYITSADHAFQISYSDNIIIYKGDKFFLSVNEAAMDKGVLFIREEVLERVFEFKINFRFRSLSADFSADFELPIVKLMKLEKTRENLKKIKEEVVYDTIFPQQYHAFRFGTIDWSFSSNQSQSHKGETRLGMGMGTELLGGETDIWLNYSDRYGLDKYRQRYYWRYVNNKAKIIRQIQFGRVSDRTIASILSPVDGFSITNSPTTVRKAAGDYQISDYTEPDWIVELYVNNTLINFTTADASGFYTFSVPLVYGSSRIKLCFYGPNGEERKLEKTFSMPYNMLPSGELEYKLSGGMMLDTLNSVFSRTEAHYGISRWLTVGAGTEYLSSLNISEIPFLDFTVQPIAKLILSGEYAHQVRTKFTLNYTFPGNMVLALEYSKYREGQEAINYNYLEERLASLSVPLPFKKVSGNTVGTFRQYVYSNFTYNNGQLLFSAYCRNYNANVSSYFNWTNLAPLTVYSNISISAKLKRGFSFRPSLQYNYITGQLISFKAELEKKFSSRGYISVGFEDNVLSDYRSFNLSLRYDLPFMTTYTSSYFSNKQIQASVGASGSFALDSKEGYSHVEQRSSVGRSGIVIKSFIDINFNNVQDKGEPLTNQLKVKCNGGQISQDKKDSLIYISRLEPFVDYSLFLDGSNFENIAWRIEKKSIKVCTTPNQFRKVSIPIHPVGEVSGMIVSEEGEGIGRILIYIIDKKGELIAKVQSESDGYFSYLGLPPGNYTVSVAPYQLQILKKKATSVLLSIHEDVLGDVIDIGNLVLKEIAETQSVTNTISE